MATGRSTSSPGSAGSCVPPPAARRPTRCNSSSGRGLLLTTPSRPVPGGRSGAAAVLAQEDADRSVRPRARCVGDGEARADHQDRRRHGVAACRTSRARPTSSESTSRRARTESRLAHGGREAVLRRRLQRHRPPLRPQRGAAAQAARLGATAHRTRRETRVLVIAAAAGLGLGGSAAETISISARPTITGAGDRA